MKLTGLAVHLEKVFEIYKARKATSPRRTAGTHSCSVSNLRCWSAEIGSCVSAKPLTLRLGPSGESVHGEIWSARPRPPLPKASFLLHLAARQRRRQRAVALPASARTSRSRCAGGRHHYHGRAGILDYSTTPPQLFTYDVPHFRSNLIVTFDQRHRPSLLYALDCAIIAHTAIRTNVSDDTNKHPAALSDINF